MKLNKWVIVLLVAILAAPLFGGGGRAPAQSGDPNQPFEMTFFAECYLPEPPSPDLEVFQIIQRETNTKLIMTWMTDTNTKINTTIASGSDMPMVMFVPNPRQFNIVSAAEAGIFWDLGKYIEMFPEVKALYDPVRSANVKILGKDYGIVRKRPTTQYSVIYRRDWLDNLGMKPPETVDQLFEMWRAFTEDDPDKNGQKDTFGLVMRENLQYYQFITLLYGAPNGWKFENGKMVPEFMTEEFFKGLDVFREAYARGFINNDFPVVKGAQLRDMINNGRGGSYIGQNPDAASQHEALYKLEPNAKIDLTDCLTGPGGKKTIADPGVQGQYMVTTRAVRDEATLLRVMNYFEKINSPPLQDLLRWGLEGKHHRIQDGKPTRPSEWNDAFIREVNVLRALKQHYDEKARDGIMDYAYQRGRDLSVFNEPFGVGDPSYPLMSQTFVERGSELSTMIVDAVVKYVMGEINRAGFETIIRQWNSQGGQRLIDEYTAAYNKK